MSVEPTSVTDVADGLRRVGYLPGESTSLVSYLAAKLGKPVLVPERSITGLGSAIFAFLASNTFATIEDAQRALCPPYRAIEPDPAAHATYERLYEHWRSLYFAMGRPDSEAVAIGRVLPEIRAIAVEARE